MKIGKVVHEYSAMEHGELDLVIGKTIEILQKVNICRSYRENLMYNALQMNILWIYCVILKREPIFTLYLSSNP